MKTAFSLSLALGSRVSELHALLKGNKFVNFNGVLSLCFQTLIAYFKNTGLPVG